MDKIDKILYKKCPKNYTQKDGKCIENCPQGWKMANSTCERPCQIGTKKNGKCEIKYCPDGTTKINNKCVHSCKDNTIEINDKCYSNCPDGTSLLDETKCIDNCPTGFQTTDTECKKTIYSCTSGSIPIGSKCYKSCPSGFKVKFSDKTKCYSTCNDDEEYVAYQTTTGDIIKKCFKKCPDDYFLRKHPNRQPKDCARGYRPESCYTSYWGGCAEGYYSSGYNKCCKKGQLLYNVKPLPTSRDFESKEQDRPFFNATIRREDYKRTVTDRPHIEKQRDDLSIKYNNIETKQPQEKNREFKFLYIGGIIGILCISSSLIVMKK
jgi:hypothetical protein